MGKLKVRKIGNSLGSIFPKSWEVHDGAQLSYKVDKEKHQVIIDLRESDLEHDRQLIEDSFQDFEHNEWINEHQMKEKFGKYGWGK